MKSTNLIPSEGIQTLLDKAEEHFEKSEYVEAEKIAKVVLSSFDLTSQSGGKGKQEKTNKGRTFCLLGFCSIRSAYYDNAFKYFNIALKAVKSIPNLSLISKVKRGIAETQRMQGDLKSSLNTAVEAQILAEQAGDKEEQMQVMNTKGIIYRFLGDYSLAMEYSILALSIAKEIGKKKYIALIEGNIGVIRGDQGDYPEALAFYTSALSIAEELINKRLIAMYLGNTGNVHFMLGDYSLAFDYYIRALKIGEEISDKANVGRYLNQIGNIHFYFSDYHRAFDYYFRSLKILEEIGDKIQIATSLGNIGNVYSETGDYIQALEYYNRALKHTELTGDLRMSGVWMHNIACTERMAGNLDSALGAITNALHIRRDLLKTKEDVALTLLELGCVLIGQSKHNEGIERLKESLLLAEEFGEKRTVSKAYMEISNAYSKLNDMLKAYDYITKHLTLDKEIFSEESRKSIEKFNMRMAIAEKEHEMEIQKIRAENLEGQLSAKAIAYASQTELLATFREDLRRIIRKIEVRDPAINELIAKLRELPEAVNWKEFEEQFRQVHPEFKMNLQKKFPELSDDELQVCALFRLKLKSPDIGKLLSISWRTVQNRRNRIRKKLGLKSEDDIAKFLGGF